MARAKAGWHERGEERARALERDEQCRMEDGVAGNWSRFAHRFRWQGVHGQRSRANAGAPVALPRLQGRQDRVEAKHPAISLREEAFAEQSRVEHAGV